MRKWWILGMCLVACSSAEAPTDGGSDASADDVKADVVQEAGTGCNSVTNIGPVIQQTYVATDPVAGDGGPIVYGTYVMTAYAFFTGADGGSGPTGTTLQETAVVEDGGSYETVQSAVNDAGADGSPYRANGIVTFNGSSVQIDQKCPKASLPFNSYDSDGTKIRFYAPAAGAANPGIMVEYTKQ